MDAKMNTTSNCESVCLKYTPEHKPFPSIETLMSKKRQIILGHFPDIN